jgi:predicted house-cleaning noncanonical NTP pyrophosphatase (MazG superfamily)
MTEHNKLVRDRVPEIIRMSGRTPVIRELEPEEFLVQLDFKLDEEVREYLESGAVAELADVLEVIHAIANARGYSSAELEELRAAKARERGGFGARLFLERVLEES